MRTFSLFFLPSLAACYPNVATDDRVDALEDALVTANDTILALQEQVDAMSDYETRIAACESKLETHEAQITTLESSTVWVIDEDTTYDVSSVEELDATLTELDHARIASGVTVTIDLANGVYEFTEPLTVDHPDGSRIHLVGNTTDPEAVELNFRGTDGVVVAPGRSLGLLAGFALSGDETDDTVGVDIGANATLTWGGLRITDFKRAGVRVRHGGTLRPEDLDCGGDHIEVSGGDLTVYGFEVSDGGTAIVCDSVARDMTETGFYVAFESYLSAEGATSEGNGQDGFHAAFGSTLVASKTTTSNNEDVGIEGAWASVVAADSADSTLDRYGFYVSHGSAMKADASTVSDADTDGYTAYGNSYLSATDATVLHVDRNGFLQDVQSVLSAPGANVSDVTTGFWSTTQGYIYAYGTSVSNYTDTAYYSDHQGVIYLVGYTDDGSGDLLASDASAEEFGYAWK